MASPRFTRGRLGRLSFDVLNEIIARLDRLEGVPGRPRRVKYDPRLVFRAKIIDVRSNQGSDSGGFSQEASFDEVVIDGIDPGAVLRGGRTSYRSRTTQTDPFHEPIIGDNLTAGSTVFVHPTNTVRGKLRYLVISGAAAGRVSAPHIITNSIDMTTNQSQKMWRYIVYPMSMTMTTQSRIDSIAITTGGYSAFNLTEFNIDANNQYGLGFKPDIIPPPGPTLVRQPIKNGTVVEVFTYPNSATSGTGPPLIPYFLAPNGYEVTCP